MPQVLPFLLFNLDGRRNAKATNLVLLSHRREHIAIFLLPIHHLHDCYECFYLLTKLNYIFTWKYFWRRNFERHKWTILATFTYYFIRSLESLKDVSWSPILVTLVFVIVYKSPATICACKINVYTTSFQEVAQDFPNSMYRLGLLCKKTNKKKTLCVPLQPLELLCSPPVPQRWHYVHFSCDRAANHWPTQSSILHASRDREGHWLTAWSYGRCTCRCWGTGGGALVLRRL